MDIGMSVIKQVYKKALKQNRGLFVEKTLDCYYKIFWTQPEWRNGDLTIEHISIGYLSPNDRPHPLKPTKGIK